MAKDRFKTRASWDPSFKYTGQTLTISPPKRELLSGEQRHIISEMLQNKKYLNDWETKFLRDILIKNFKLSIKQKNKVRDIFYKIAGCEKITEYERRD